MMSLLHVQIVAYQCAMNRQMEALFVFRSPCLHQILASYSIISVRWKYCLQDHRYLIVLTLIDFSWQSLVVCKHSCASPWSACSPEPCKSHLEWLELRMFSFIPCAPPCSTVYNHCRFTQDIKCASSCGHHARWKQIHFCLWFQRPWVWNRGQVIVGSTRSFVSLRWYCCIISFLQLR